MMAQMQTKRLFFLSLKLVTEVLNYVSVYTENGLEDLTAHTVYYNLDIFHCQDLFFVFCYHSK